MSNAGFGERRENFCGNGYSRNKRHADCRLIAIAPFTVLYIFPGLGPAVILAYMDVYGIESQNRSNIYVYIYIYIGDEADSGV